MVQQRKASVVKVSRHRSSDNKHKHRSIKTKRPNTIIHATIGLSRKTRLIENSFNSITDDERKASRQSVHVTKVRLHDRSLSQFSQTIRSKNLTKKWSSKVSGVTKSVIHPDDIVNGISNAENHRSRSSKLTHYEDINEDRRGMTKDYHQTVDKKKKTKCSRQCIIRSLLGGALLIIIILAIVLPILLIKSKSTTKPNVALLRWNITGITVAGLSGVAGNASNQLNAPYDAVVDYSNALYIADQGNNRIQRYLMGESTGVTVAGQANGTAGVSSNQLYGCSNVLVDSNKNIYITDRINNRIQFWTNGVSVGTTIAGDASGTGGSSNNLFNGPYGIARDLSTNTLYIADYANHRVMSYASGATAGSVVAGGNGPGLNQTQLWDPIGLYFDSFSNSLLITNFASHTVVRWVIGASSWTLVAGDNSGIPGNTSTLLNNPRDVTLDPMGNMYVVDRSNNRIQLYMVGESNAITIAGFSDNNSTSLNVPRSVELDNQLNLYITDGSNNRIQKFIRY